jgi:hypothetical protein
MKPTVTIEIPADSEAFVRQLLALHEELQDLALAAPDGTVLDACEMAILQRGRALHTQLLAAAVARRVAAAEKRGPRSAPAPAVGPRKTAAVQPVSS